MVFTVLKSNEVASHTILNYYLKTYFLSEFEAKRQYTSLSSFDVRTNVQKMASLCQILIFEQIRVEKNGFRSLKERQIRISYHIKLLSKNLLFVRI